MTPLAMLMENGQHITVERNGFDGWSLGIRYGSRMLLWHLRPIERTSAGGKPRDAHRLSGKQIQNGLTKIVADFCRRLHSPFPIAAIDPTSIGNGAIATYQKTLGGHRGVKQSCHIKTGIQEYWECNTELFLVGFQILDRLGLADHSHNRHALFAKLGSERVEHRTINLR